MSERVTLTPGSEVEEEGSASVEACLGEMRRLETLIARDRARSEASKRRSADVWEEIRRLKAETRSLLKDLKARVV